MFKILPAAVIELCEVPAVVNGVLYFFNREYPGVTGSAANIIYSFKVWVRLRVVDDV